MSLGSPQDARFAPVDRLFLSLIPFGPVLELGCGDGRVLAMLDEAGYEVTGVDLDRAALDRARARGLERLICADAHRLPLEDTSFGAVLSGFFSANLFDPTRFLPEAARVLKPGGVLAYTLLNPVTRGLDRLQFALRHGRLNPKALQRAMARLRPPARDHAWLQSVGLVPNPLSGPMYLPGLRRLRGAMARAPVLRGSWAQLSWDVVVSGTRPVGRDDRPLSDRDEVHLATLHRTGELRFDAAGPRYCPHLCHKLPTPGTVAWVIQPSGTACVSLGAIVPTRLGPAWRIPNGTPVWSDAILAVATDAAGDASI